jgi:hypothetical protein
MSVHGSYWFIQPEYRKQRHSRWLFGAMEQLLGRTFGPDMWLLYEVNDPLRMTPEKLRLDFMATGQDPVDRLAASCAWGDRLLDLDYVQPALGPGKQDEHGLLLMARGGQSIPSQVLARHLEAFFGLSVIKTGDCRDRPVAQRQVDAILKRNTPVGTLSIQPWLPALRLEVAHYLQGQDHINGDGLRAWLRRQAP